MAKMKTKIAFSLILASIVLLVAFPQYGLLALSETNVPQTTTLTAPNFTVSASPSRLYVIIGDAETSTIRVSPVNKFNGTVDLEITHVDGIIANLNRKSLTVKYNQAGYAELSVKAQPKIDPGTYNVTVTATSPFSLTHSVNVTVRVLQPDFAIRACPSTMYVLNGTTGTSNVTLTSIDRFNGTIELSASVPCGWEAPTFCKNVLTLNYPKINSTILTVNVPACAKPGKYTIVVTAESGTHGESDGKFDDMTHSVNVTVQVINPDFRIYANPSTMYLLPGTNQDSTVRVYSVDRFNGTVSLAATIPPALTGSGLTSKSLAITYNTAGTSMLNVNVPSNAKAEKYTITVTATSGTITHSVNVTVQVIKPDIVIYSSPSYIAAKAGTTQNATIRVNSLGRFNGTVTLVATSPGGWTTTMVVNPLKVTYNQSNSTKVTIAIPADAELGKYTVDFKATSGPLSDSTSIKIVVVS
jgi:uncharacterized membrane protein